MSQVYHGTSVVVELREAELTIYPFPFLAVNSEDDGSPSFAAPSLETANSALQRKRGAAEMMKKLEQKEEKEQSDGALLFRIPAQYSRS